MKYVKFILIAVLFSFTFLMSATYASRVHAAGLGYSQCQEGYSCLQCNYVFDNRDPEDATGCDLALTKQVSVNGGTFTTAETSSDAVPAHVGDTVTWQIVVKNDSMPLTFGDDFTVDLTPYGTVTVQDILPSGVTYVSSSTDQGTYDNTSGAWTFNLTNNLPATLDIVTTTNTTGSIENIASLTGYDSYTYDSPAQYQQDDPAYADANSDNNSDQAFIDVVTPTPVVVTPAAPATPSTGFGVHLTNPLAVFGVYTLGAVASLALGVAANRRLVRK